MADDENDQVLLSEVKEMLEAEQERRGELRYEQQLALEHAQKFARLDPDDARAIRDEALEIDRVTPALATKIADLCPRDEEDVQAIFAKERFNLGDDDIKKILDAVAKYV